MKSVRRIPRLVFEAGGMLLVVLSVLVGYRRRRGTHDDLVLDECPLVESTSLVGRALARSAIHERVLFAYVSLLLLAVICGAGEGRLLAAAFVGADMAMLAAAVIALRAELIENRFAASVLARLIVFGTLIVTFLQLDVILPAARNRTVDATLYALDLKVFGFEPAVVLDRWVNPVATEWFAFFYFSYFVVLAVHVFPFMILERRTRLIGEFALGMVTVYCIGHVTYLLFPGFGPYHSLTFEHALRGGTWWHVVQSGAGAIHESARTDIFPSLHTAGPLFIALFSFRNRALKPFAHTWPIVALFSTQIILATMYLRWHYLIDVIAGIALAIGADRVARHASAEAVWCPLRPTELLQPSTSKSSDDPTR